MTTASYAVAATPRAGRILRISHVTRDTQTGDAVVTIYRNGVSTGVAFGVDAGAAGAPGLFIVDEGDQAKLEFEPGDVIELLATTPATDGGETRFWIELAGQGDVGQAVLYGYSLNVGSVIFGGFIGMSSPGRVTAMAGAMANGNDGAPVLTIYRSGIDTGVSFTLPITATKGGFLYEFNPAEQDLLDCARDDVLTILSNGAGASGTVHWNIAYKKAPEYPINEMHYASYFAGIGDPTDAPICALRRGRLVRVAGAFAEAHTGASSTLFIRKAGTALNPLPTWQAPIAAIGDVLPTEDFYEEGVANTHLKSLDVDEGENINTNSAGEGTNGACFVDLVVRGR
jgi:hypothetical protein